MTSSLVREWLFRALATEDTVDRLEADGLSVRAATDTRAMQRVLPIEEFSQTIRQAAMLALPAYLAFFCFENALRELLMDRLSEAHGHDWWEKCASANLKNKVQLRRNKEGEKPLAR